MSLYEFVKGLALLPGIICIGLVAGLLLATCRPRAGLLLLWLVTLGFYLLSAPFFANRLGVAVNTVPPLADVKQIDGAQAIVVLSAGASATGPEFGGIMLDGITVARMRYAARLHRLTQLPILVSGGLILGVPRTLASAMKQSFEEEFGIPVQWVEERSPNTAANAAYSAEILSAAGVTKIVLVTHAAHMARAMALFEATGLAVIPAPTGFTYVNTRFPRDFVPRMSALETSYYALYELLGQAWYRLRGTHSQLPASPGAT
jgi:uncharacterized SAM-binding protein YcdF (DUF218 family)